MKKGIIIKIGSNGLASAVSIHSSGLQAFLHTNTPTYIAADVTVLDAAFSVELYLLMESDTYWVNVEPFGFSAAFSLGEWGFPGGLYEAVIPDRHMQTMVAEAMIVLASVMGLPADDLCTLYGDTVELE